ncbi:MAG: glycoside hydrolase family 44 protein [Capsulimonadales bacterium]|nr:glycoside hydrolase family 44 protein [Capsulimonadales bacterium]
MYFRNTHMASAFRGAAGTLSLVLGFCPLAFAQNAATYINVDAKANRRAIDPRIYGVAFANTADLADINYVINRNGGNAATRYNYQQNADNRGSDWYFESIPDDSRNVGERVETFTRSTFAALVGAEPMITVPTIGYVAKVGANRSKLSSYSVKKYGAQTATDASWFPDAGNGILKSTGKPITNNNPLDANVPSDSLFQQGMINHLISRFGTSGTGGVKYYIYDNEPSIWHFTHRDVHPVGATMDEIKSKMIDYGTRIRDKDPNAILVGPEEWGWSGFFYSGYDQQWAGTNGWSSVLPDRSKNGNWDYMPWILDQMRQHQAKTGKRLLDIFSVHYYPQGGEFGNDVSTSMQLRRNRSTRALWDPNYKDESWIGTPVQLIPRIRAWVNQYYPGTQTAITEYNWGAENHINGATTQADIMGIFGREGLNLSARWGIPGNTTPTYKAMKMYRNYDGSKSTFGDTSVAANVANPDNLSAFAAERTRDGAMTVMAINKVLSGNTPVTLNLAGFAAKGAVQVYQLTSANVIKRLADLTPSVNTSTQATTVTTTVPPQSVTLFVLGQQPVQNQTLGTSAVANPSTVKINSKTTITLTVTNDATPRMGSIINMEIYDAAGAKVYQRYAAGQNLVANAVRSYKWDWTPTKAGTYTVKIGIFNSNWTQLYHWNNNAGTFTAQ